MNVSELYSLAMWVDREVVEATIPQKYQELQSILQQHTQPNNQRAPFASEKEVLIETLKAVPTSELSLDQWAYLEALGIGKALGDEGVAAIEDILFRNSLDVATAASQLNLIVQNLNGGLAKVKQIFAGLDGIVLEEEYEEADRVLVRVCFKDGAAMENVTDFKKWGATWHEIGRGVAMAHDSAPEDVLIVGAGKGSIVVELAVLAKIAATLSGIILAGLKVAEKVQDIRVKAEELKALKLKNTDLVKQLEQEAMNEKETGIQQIVDDFVRELKIKKNGEGEKVTVLGKSVKSLVAFVETGGEVDFVMPEEPETEEEEEGAGDAPAIDKKVRAKLVASFKEIRQIEQKIKLLE